MRKVLLLILDGWGINYSKKNNAIAQADTPFYDRLINDYPNTILEAREESVGVPYGCLSNSEVGHMSIGAGRIVPQSSLAIEAAVENGAIFENKTLEKLREHIDKNQSLLHMVGLLSNGGVHSHINHLQALIEWTNKSKIQNTALHLFLDGRDMPPMSAKDLLQPLLSKLPDNITLSSLCGRSIAMDRTENWDRTSIVFNFLTKKMDYFDDPLDYIVNQYKKNIGDEFMEPACFSPHYIDHNDAVLFFNFRADRMRQLVKLFTKRAPDIVQKELSIPKDLLFSSMTRYDEEFIDIPTLFPPTPYENTLTEWLSKQGIHQFRIAEKEKYAHITFFLNGMFEKPYPGEDRIIIPSLGSSHYDERPEMSLPQVTEKLVETIVEDSYKFILCNIANGDMVGHTGNLQAGIKAVEHIDHSLSRIIPIARQHHYTVIVTADHGNIEYMHHNGNPHTAHTFNDVPFIVTDINTILKESGYLHQISPTILDIMGIDKPSEMTSESIILHNDD